MWQRRAVADPLEVLLLDKIHLVEEHAIGEGHLLHRLILRAFSLLLVQVLLNVLRVDQSDDAVEPETSLDPIVDEEGLRNGRRVGHARRLDDDGVQLEVARLNPFRESLEHDDEVLSDGAADAAVHHLNYLFFSLLARVLGDKSIVNPNLSKLILDDGKLLPVLGGEDVVEQRRFA